MTVMVGFGWPSQTRWKSSTCHPCFLGSNRILISLGCVGNWARSHSISSYFVNILDPLKKLEGEIWGGTGWDRGIDCCLGYLDIIDVYSGADLSSFLMDFFSSSRLFVLKASNSLFNSSIFWSFALTVSFSCSFSEIKAWDD